MINSRNLLISAWVVSLVSTLGSLFWSFILQWIPCDLCWYERICMYPLTIILGVAVFSRNKNVFSNSIAFPVVGVLISMYHYAIQMSTTLAKTAACSSVIPCQDPEFKYLGFITPPLFSLVAFILILSVLFTIRNSNQSA